MKAVSQSTKSELASHGSGTSWHDARVQCLGRGLGFGGARTLHRAFLSEQRKLVRKRNKGCQNGGPDNTSTGTVGKGVGLE
eukprot:307494-Rhodomonas_salina.1